MAFSKYFAANYQNITNSAFLVEFENGPIREILQKNEDLEEIVVCIAGDFYSSTDIAHVKVSEGLIYTVDRILDKAKIEFGTPEAIQTQIDKFNSEIRFIQDAGESSWNLRRLESQRDSFVSYQRQLEGKIVAEPSLEELDQQKYILEALDGKTTELLQQYDKK